MVVPVSETQFAELAERAKSQGFELNGRAGVIERMGVKAEWNYDGANLTVNVLEKPFFLSKEAVEAKLREALA
jgi:hypothetical protein